MTADEYNSMSSTLSWRMDPLKSRSDWSIDIVYKSSETRERYHVHRNIIMVGPCHSPILAEMDLLSCNGTADDVCPICSTVLRYSMQNERTTTTTDVTHSSDPSIINLTVPDAAAEAFPDFLDCIYWINLGQQKRVYDTLCPVNALPIWYLSDFLGVERLKNAVISFVSIDLVATKSFLANSPLYCEQAILFNQEEMLQMVANTMVPGLYDVFDVAPFIKVVNADLLKRVAVSITDCRRNDFDMYHGVNKAFCNLIAGYCEQQTCLSPQEFITLTNEEHLPMIDCETCRRLIELEDKIVGVDKNKSSSLRSRCLVSINESFDKVGWVADDTLLLLQQYPRMQVEFLKQLCDRMRPYVRDQNHGIAAMASKVTKLW